MLIQASIVKVFERSVLKKALLDDLLYKERFSVERTNA